MARNKIEIIIIIIVIIISLIYFFALPKYQALGQLENALIQKQLDYEARADYYGKIFKILGEMKERKDVLGKIDSALPTDVSSSSLIYFLQTKGVENGLSVKAIVFPNTAPTTYGKVAKKTNVKDIKNIVLGVGLSGSYQNLKKFLFSLDNSIHQMQVNSISFSSAQAPLDPKLQNQPVTHDFRLEIQTYTY